MGECADKYSEWIVGHLADELDEERRIELEQHIGTCQECRRALEESRRVVRLYKDIPADEPGAEIVAQIHGEAFMADASTGQTLSRVAPDPHPSRGEWFALAALVIFALGAGLGYALYYLQAQSEKERFRVEQAAENTRLKQEAEAVYQAAADVAADVARVAEETAVEARRLKGKLEEKEALARAAKLVDEAEKAMAKAKAAGGKAGSGAGKKKATGKAGGKKRNALGDDPLGADYEL